MPKNKKNKKKFFKNKTTMITPQQKPLITPQQKPLITPPLPKFLVCFSECSEQHFPNDEKDKKSVIKTLKDLSNGTYQGRNVHKLKGKYNGILSIDIHKRGNYRLLYEKHPYINNTIKIKKLFTDETHK